MNFTEVIERWIWLNPRRWSVGGRTNAMWLLASAFLVLLPVLLLFNTVYRPFGAEYDFLSTDRWGFFADAVYLALVMGFLLVTWWLNSRDCLCKFTYGDFGILIFLGGMILCSGYALSEIGERCAEQNIMITIKDKAISSSGDHLVLDSNGARWRVEDPFLYKDLMTGETYEILYEGVPGGTLEGRIIDAKADLQPRGGKL